MGGDSSFAPSHHSLCSWWGLSHLGLDTMKTCTRIALCYVILLSVPAWSSAQEKAQATVTITVPEKGHGETIVTVYSKENFEGATKAKPKEAKKKKMVHGDYYTQFKGESTTRTLRYPSPRRKHRSSRSRPTSSRTTTPTSTAPRKSRSRAATR